MRLQLPFRIRDAHLHRPAGSHRVVAGEEALAQRHLADEVLEQVAQLLLAARGADPLAPGAAVRRSQLQGGLDQERRYPGALGAAIDFRARDPAETGHRGVGAKRRLLLGDGKHRADVGETGLEPQGVERGVDVDRPAWAIGDARRQQRGDAGAHLLGTRRCGRWRRAAAGEDEAGSSERTDQCPW